MSEQRTLDVALIGTGHIADLHAAAIERQENVRLVAVSDRNEEAAQDAARRWNVPAVYTDPGKMIDERKPTAVHVLVPPQFHAELSLLAIERGCHVLVEKPMALELQDAQRMVEASKAKGVCLCVDHNLVYEATIQRAKQIVARGDVGDTVSVETRFVFDVERYPAVLEEGAERVHWAYRMKGGPLQDLMPHPASLLMEFLPCIDEFHGICHARGKLPGDWPDEARLLVRGGAVSGYLGLSLNEGMDAVELIVRGTKGTLSANLFNNSLVVQRKSALPRAAVRGLSPLRLSASYLAGGVSNVFNFATGRIDKSGGIEPVVRGFYAAVRTGCEPPISIEKSLCVVELMDRLWPASARPEPAEVRAAASTGEGSCVLVTGGSGFIGTHLVDKLIARGHMVRALVRPGSPRLGRLLERGVEIFQGSLSNVAAIDAAVNGAEIVYHAGAATGNEREDNERSTIQGTKNVLDACVRHGVRRLVHFSTLAVYDLISPEPGSRIREDSPFLQQPESMGLYAWAKLETERIVRQPQASGAVEVTIVRPGIVVGPLGRAFFPHLGFKYRDKLFVMPGGGRNVLPLTYVENTVDAIYAASTSEAAIGRDYNIVDGGMVTARDYLERFVSVTGNDTRLVGIPYVVPYAAIGAYEVVSGFGLLKKGVTSRAQLKTKQASVIFDNSRLREELAWQPPVDLMEGLDRTFRWYKQRFL